MSISATILGAAGIFLSFLPQESAGFMGWSSTDPVVFQLLGALYFGFAMVNWTAKANLIGGIYGRPVAIGNFTHFLIAALALIKISFKAPTAPIIAVAIVYSLLAILFGYIFFTHPLKKTSSG